MGVTCYLIYCSFDCISLMMVSDVEHLFTCPFVYLLWRNVYSTPLPIFESGCLAFCCCSTCDFKSESLWESAVLLEILCPEGEENLEAFCQTKW